MPWCVDFSLRYNVLQRRLKSTHRSTQVHQETLALISESQWENLKLLKQNH